MDRADRIAEMVARLEGDERRLVEIFVERLLAGHEVYGVWHAHTERRDLRREQAEEGVDFLEYAMMRAVARMLSEEET